MNGNKDSAAKLEISRGFNGADLSSLFRGGVGQEGGYPFPIKREEHEAEAERRNGELCMVSSEHKPKDSMNVCAVVIKVRLIGCHLVNT